MTYEDEFYMFAGVWYSNVNNKTAFKEDTIQREESGGWFRKQLDVDEVDPGDFQDYVSDTVDGWRVGMIS